MTENASGNVVVCARCRPLNKKEIALGASCCLDFNSNKKGITINMSTDSGSAFGQNTFVFDRVFNMDSNQKEVYDYAARPIIDQVLEGFNGTIFAYG